jgi:hypothetical protein
MCGGDGIQVGKKQGFFSGGSGMTGMPRAQQGERIRLSREEVVVGGGDEGTERFFRRTRGRIGTHFSRRESCGKA